MQTRSEELAQSITGEVGMPIKLSRAIQVGGPLGTYLPDHQWDVPLDYEAYTAIGALPGFRWAQRISGVLPS